MALRCLGSCRRHLRDLNRLLSFAGCDYRGSVCLYSAAAHHRSTGDECHVDEPADEPSHVMTIRMLELRASKLEEQVQDLTERYKRAVADSDTVRRRTQKFVEDAKVFGIQSFCRDLVEVADILERTAGDVESEFRGQETQRRRAEGAAAGVADLEGQEGGEGSPPLHRLSEGLALVQERLQAVFTKHGLEKMAPVGGRYDPYQHEIVCHVAAEEGGAQPGTIALVRQDGYKLHGRTIRHAHVGVAVEAQED
ncbi:grpE protein homolog 2, mitochondrial [Amia ocellicauda]|uniref:grpE protein homolog 2, mitochondrial n=1 Tax=Amia ocellicauda TaxID=2972642 RepID=UPI003463BAF3